MRSRLRALVLATLGAVAITSYIGAQDAGQFSQETPTWCWGCGDPLTGTNPSECYWGWVPLFGQSATQCNTHWGPEGARCELAGTFCGEPFFASVDGSAGVPGARLAYSATVASAGNLIDCQGRILTRVDRGVDPTTRSLAGIAL
jgi:hypothetical protein